MSSRLYLFAALFLLLLTAILFYPVVAYHGPRSYFDISDIPKHIGMIAAILSSGLPPDNPFFHSDSPANYYYFFYLVPAALHLLTFKLLDPYFCFALVSLVLSGLWIFYLYNFIKRWTGSERSALLCTIFATTASGLDLVALALHSKSLMPFVTNGLIEAWESPATTAMMNPFFFQLFYQQHLAALLMTLLIGDMIVYPRSQRWQFALIGAALFVAFGFSFFIGGVALLSCLIMSFWQRRQLFWGVIMATVFIAVTFLPTLLQPNADQLVHIAVAKIGGLSEAAFFSHWFHQKTWARLLDLPLHLLLEIGFILPFSLIWLWRMRRNSARFDTTGYFALTLSIVSLLIIVFVRLDGIYNDISMKLSGMLTLGMVLLAANGFANDVFFRGWKRYLSYGAVGLAIWSTVLMACWRLSPTTYVGITPESLAANRWIAGNLPKASVIQRGILQEANPSFPYFALRMTAVSDTYHARFLAHSQSQLAEQTSAIEQMFYAAGPKAKCAGLRFSKIDYLYLGPAEQRAYPTWQEFLDTTNFEIVYKNPTVTIVRPLCPIESCR